MAARAIDGVFYFLERQRRKFGVEQKVAPAVCRWSRAVARRNCAIMKALSTMRTMATRKIILQDVQHEALHHTRAMDLGQGVATAAQRACAVGLLTRARMRAY